jgi:8-oxo-dGTP diphosphatase
METIEKKNKFAVIATDVVIFTVHKNHLKILLIKMKRKPYIGYWACPGGLVRPNESVNEAAKKHLFDKAGLEDVYLEQLYTFGEPDRDPFGRVVSVAYFALIPTSGIELKTTKEYADIAWFTVKSLPKLAYDHKQVIEIAEERLKNKLAYSNIIYSLLPEEFTLGELQGMYEIILGRKLDKRNFRKKIFSLGIIGSTGKKRIGEASRPAGLYKFVNRDPRIVEML